MNTQTLNDLMQIDHVIRVNADGSIDEPTGVYAPELSIGCDDDGQISEEDDQDMIDYAQQVGWTLLTGWTGQEGYRGPLMHASEYVGGALEQHIRDTPGLWVATAIYTDDDSNGDNDLAGWVLAYRAS